MKQYTFMTLNRIVTPQGAYKPTSLDTVPGRPIGDATLLAKVVAIVSTTLSLRVCHVLVMLGVSQSQVSATESA
jgi:hypothetical protein